MSRGSKRGREKGKKGRIERRHGEEGIGAKIKREGVRGGRETGKKRKIERREC